MEVVTYANKSHGLFEELIHNEYDVPVRVLGWGTKWNGFLDKYKGMVEYLKSKKDDDIVIFLDGFDTKINKDPKDVSHSLNPMIVRCWYLKTQNHWVDTFHIKYLTRVLGNPSLIQVCTWGTRNTSYKSSKMHFV